MSYKKYRGGLCVCAMHCRNLLSLLEWWRRFQYSVLMRHIPLLLCLNGLDIISKNCDHHTRCNYTVAKYGAISEIANLINMFYCKLNKYVHQSTCNYGQLLPKIKVLLINRPTSSSNAHTQNILSMQNDSTIWINASSQTDRSNQFNHVNWTNLVSQIKSWITDT